MNLPSWLTIQVVVFVVAFLLALFLGPVFIPMLRRLKFGQTVRDDGPASHLKKTGTPTMGGIIFLAPILLLSIYFARYYPKILPLAFVTVGFGLIGFIDDLIKIVKKRKDGLYAYQKMFGLLVISTAFTFYIAFQPGFSSDIIIPFLGVNATFNFGMIFYIPFSIFILLATTNTVNLTDGLDGLAAGVTLIVMVFFTVVAMTRGEWDFVKVFSASVAGGCLGFLAFNIHPAKVFMGDVGSLALGGAVGAISVMMKLHLVLLIFGGIYIIEALSDIIQVASFKLRGKRVFKMAPIHHHFELSGWKETKVVKVFWIAQVVLCILAVFALRLKFF